MDFDEEETNEEEDETVSKAKRRVFDERPALVRLLDLGWAARPENDGDEEDPDEKELDLDVSGLVPSADSVYQDSSNSGTKAAAIGF